MSFVTGSLILDAPASALNNAGPEAGAPTKNVVSTKKIRTPDGTYPYVSAQAVRYWIRTSLELNAESWKSSPVRYAKEIAFTDGEPQEYWDDDLFGYMRAESRKAGAGKASEASPLEEKREITRISPFRVSTFVSLGPVSVVRDWGTMARQDDNPVPHEHEFYRAHLAGLLSLDLTSAGTFYDGERVGYKNLDSHRRDKAKSKKLAEVTVRRQKAFRLPIEERMERVSTLVGALARLNGGAKQALHYTDLTPAVVFLAITKHGNNPFHRMLVAGRAHVTEFHRAAFEEVMRVYENDFISPIHVGWMEGFLDEERAKLQAAIQDGKWGGKVTVDHPVVQIERVAGLLRRPENSGWYD
jgi:CRISPR-associated protein Cst2